MMLQKNIQDKIAVAISGGVDSAATALILKRSGFDIALFFLDLFPEDPLKRGLLSDIKKISSILDIPLFTINAEKRFRYLIIDPFFKDYMLGITPNPCVECNRLIKFGLLMECSKNRGYNKIATGHYCIIKKSVYRNSYIIKKGRDRKKDQSYMLWHLNQSRLSRIITPLGRYHKDKIKKMVIKEFPFLRNRRESQEICFIKDNDYRTQLSRCDRSIKQGNIIDIEGKILGKHKGFPFYTIGQRKGLGISNSRPLYVIDIIPEKNIVVAGEEKYLYSKDFYIRDLNLIDHTQTSKTFGAEVKIRYNSSPKPALINIMKNKSALISFKKPQKSITPGQSAVFYKKDRLIGGGVIFKKVGA